MSIPVWHDDQQGSATVVLAALLAASEVVGKSLDRLRIVLFGIGAANVATYRLLTAYGLDPKAIVACDSKGILHAGRSDIERQKAEFSDKWRICLESNGDNRRGPAGAAFIGADVCIAFSSSGPDVIRPEWIRTMAKDAIVFACANPVPEIWPDAARNAGARIVATGRSDFPNQVNNSLVFPGLVPRRARRARADHQRSHGNCGGGGAGGCGKGKGPERGPAPSDHERLDGRGAHRRCDRHGRGRGRVGAQSIEPERSATDRARHHQSEPGECGAARRIRPDPLDGPKSPNGASFTAGGKPERS